MHIDFTITLGQIATIISVLTGAGAIVHQIGKLIRTIQLRSWEHKVLWGWFTRHHKEHVPTYPHLVPKSSERDHG